MLANNLFTYDQGGVRLALRPTLVCTPVSGGDVAFERVSFAAYYVLCLA